MEERRNDPLGVNIGITFNEYQPGSLVVGLVLQIQEMGVQASKMEGQLLIENRNFNTASPSLRMSHRNAVYSPTDKGLERQGT